MTEVSKHTPGPWEWVRSGNTRPYLSLDGAESVIISTEMPAGWASIKINNEADARLIASAPDMHEAAAPFAAYGHTLLGQKVSDDDVVVELWGHKITVGDFRKLAIAFAKAEGGTS